jgi:hypothetical protein
MFCSGSSEPLKRVQTRYPDGCNAQDKDYVKSFLCEKLHPLFFAVSGAFFHLPPLLWTGKSADIHPILEGNEKGRFD